MQLAEFPSSFDVSKIREKKILALAIRASLFVRDGAISFLTGSRLFIDTPHYAAP